MTEPLAYLELAMAKQAQGDHWAARDHVRKHVELLSLKGINFANNVDLVNEVSRTWSRYQWVRPSRKRNSSVVVDHRPLMEQMLRDGLDFAHRIDELCQILGCPLSPQEFDLEILRYQSLCSFGLAAKALKLAVNVAFCRHWEKTSCPQLPPALPSWFAPERALPRPLRVTLGRIRSRPKAEKYALLVNTLFQGLKKGLLPIMDHEIEDSLLSHAASLATAVETPEPLLNRFSSLSKEFAERYLRPLEQDDPVCRRMSRKATREVSMAEGGNLGAFREFAYCWVDPSSKMWALAHVPVPEFIGYVAKYEGGKICHVDPEEVRVLMPVWREDFLTWLKTTPGYRGSSYAVPSVILEPFKARIITKPSLGQSCFMQPLQKRLWTALRNVPGGYFALIGEPLQRSHLWSVVSQCSDQTKKLVSADFKAATDNAHSDASRAVLDPCLAELDVGIMSEIRVQRSMCSSKISRHRPNGDELSPYPRDSPYSQFFTGGELPEFRMQNGQLMGHNVSFPILCMLNYCALHCSWEEYLGRRVKFGRIPPALFNGDDALFACDDRLYRIWERNVKAIGLSPSVGKNFVSRDFLQINSELYLVRYGTRFTDLAEGVSTLPGEGPIKALWPEESYVSDLRKVPYVNFGMLTCRKKMDCSTDYSVRRVGLEMTDEDEGVPSWMLRVKQAWSIWRNLLKGLPTSMAEVVQALWRKHHSGFLEGKLSWLRRLYPGFNQLPEHVCEASLRATVAIVAFPHSALFDEWQFLPGLATLDRGQAKKARKDSLGLGLFGFDVLEKPVYQRL